MGGAETLVTHLEQCIGPLVARNPGASGIHLLREPREAFAARFLLAQAAERTLDVQYYIWHKDLAGTLLFKALLDAANRGVRVRLLLDDNNTVGLDPTLAALDAHPQIDVRLFNPFFVRRPRIVGYLTDFFRANRRMHNKSFTVDRQATIIGGRNVGDEYFGATEGILFADLDLLAMGPVVEEVASDFERYWTSASAYPIAQVVPPAGPPEIAALETAVADCARDPRARLYLETLRESGFTGELMQGGLPLEWAVTSMVSDDPAKGLGRAARKSLLPEKLKAMFGEPAAEVDLVSAYFVPTKALVESFRSWAARGVRMRILTNSLEATDVPAVHAGYAKRRRALLHAGIALYELRRGARPRSSTKRRGSGSSGSSLHAKAFAVDQSRVFIGSFNFDPRSAELNTEMGFVIESPAIAGELRAEFDTRVPQDAYEVRWSDTGKLQWIERREGEAIRHDREPGTTVWKRGGIWVLSRLPIEWLL